MIYEGENLPLPTFSNKVMSALALCMAHSVFANVQNDDGVC